MIVVDIGGLTGQFRTYKDMCQRGGSVGLQTRQAATELHELPGVLSMRNASVVGSRVVVFVATAAMTGCSTGPPVHIRYVGSSTVAVFLRDAEPVYKAATFDIDTQPESEGGERAILEGSTDFAGIARYPGAETLRSGIVASLIGRDAIAVIVNAQIPVEGLSRDDLRSIFTGKMRKWSAAGGPDVPIEAFIVGPGSATRKVFRKTVLDREDYAHCVEIEPDQAIIDAVAGAPGGIGQISFSFLARDDQRVRAIAVDGEKPSVTNFQYPIARPLYLLWREGHSGLDAFVRWAGSDEGQRVVMRHFVGTRVVASVRSTTSDDPANGTLIVNTETYSVYDGGIYYYPHRPYEILTRHGEFVRRVANHRGENDESATRVSLPPETYLVRVESSRGSRPEFFVTVEARRTTELNVGDLMKEAP